MELLEYKSLSEKSEYFQTGDSKVNDAKSFNYVFEHLRKLKKGKFIFRGVKEAKYKLYNSAQRCFIENNLQVEDLKYKEFISSQITQCKSWNNGAIPKLMNKIGIHEDNYLAYLSLLQHSGNPSPCIDFSNDPLVALFFAFHNLEKNNNSEIENYVSIYMIDSASTWYFVDLGNTILESIRERNLLLGENNDITLNSIVPFNVLFEFEQPIMIDITINEAYRTINSMNIIHQEGRLLFNSSYNRPIEELSIERLQKRNSNYHEIKCINFNKSLKEVVLNQLAEKGYSYNTLFEKK